MGGSKNKSPAQKEKAQKKDTAEKKTSKAAKGTAAEGSTTIFIRSKSKRIASTIEDSETVTISFTYC